MFGSGNNVVLRRSGQIDEIRAVARHSDHQTLETIRMTLGFRQRFLVDAIDLDVIPAVIDIGVDQVDKLSNAVFRFQRISADPEIG